MKSIIEYKEFIRKAEKEFGEEGRNEIISFLSNNPKAGKKLERSGGIRKLDWHQKGRKNTEHCIYFHPGGKSSPLAIISIFKKNERSIIEKIIEILIYNKVISS